MLTLIGGRGVVQLCKLQKTQKIRVARACSLADRYAIDALTLTLTLIGSKACSRDLVSYYVARVLSIGN